MKTCIKCKIEKNEKSYSSKEWSYKSGGRCKKCMSEYNKKYNENGKEEISKQQKEYRKNHKEEISENNKKYYEDHKKEISEKNRGYREDHKEENRKYQKEYKKNHKEQRKEYEKNRKSNDPTYKLRCYIPGQIRYALKRNGNSKQGNSCLKFLPKDYIQQLRKHIENLFEPWMNWDNWGVLKNWDDNDPSTWTWQLDHIIPHSTFKYTSMTDQSFKECWALSNLRPYPANLNCLDGSTRVRH